MSLSDRMRPRTALLAGNRSLFSLCLLLFLTSAVLSFWYFFPAEVLQRYLLQEISQQSGLKLEGENADMLFPFGLELNLKVSSPQVELPPLLLEDLQLTPAWMRLLSGSPAADLHATLAGGSLDVIAVQDGHLTLQLSAAELGQLWPQELPYRLQGQLNGELEVEDFSAGENSQGDYLVRLDSLVALGLERLGLPERVELGQLQLEGKFNQRRLSVERVQLTQGVVEMSGGGTLLIGDTPEQTRINLNIRLQPNSSTPDGLRDLFSLSGVKPTADGSYLLRISGTLARPTLR